MDVNTNFEKVKETMKILSTIEKIKLIHELIYQVECELKLTQSKPLNSLRGLWKGIDTKEEEIGSGLNPLI